MVNYDGLYSKEYYEQNHKLNENHFYDKKIHFKIIKNGTLLPYISFGGNFGGIVDDKNNFIKSSYYRTPDAAGAYTPNEEVPYSPATVVYLGMLHKTWGHSITDNLKHVWFLQSDIYKRYFNRVPVVFVPCGKGGSSK